MTIDFVSTPLSKLTRCDSKNKLNHLEEEKEVVDAFHRFSFSFTNFPRTRPQDAHLNLHQINYNRPCIDSSFSIENVLLHNKPKPFGRRKTVDPLYGFPFSFTNFPFIKYSELKPKLSPHKCQSTLHPQLTRSYSKTDCAI